MHARVGSAKRRWLAGGVSGSTMSDHPEAVCCGRCQAMEGSRDRRGRDTRQHNPFAVVCLIHLHAEGDRSSLCRSSSGGGRGLPAQRYAAWRQGADSNGYARRVGWHGFRGAVPAGREVAPPDRQRRSISRVRTHADCVRRGWPQVFQHCHAANFAAVVRGLRPEMIKVRLKLLLWRLAGVCLSVLYLVEIAGHHASAAAACQVPGHRERGSATRKAATGRRHTSTVARI